MSEDSSVQDRKVEVRRVVLLLAVLAVVVALTVVVKLFAVSKRRANVNAARALAEQAVTYLNEGSLVEGAATAAQALERASGELDVTRTYVAAMIKIGSVEDAVEQCNRLVREYPDETEPKPSKLSLQILQREKAGESVVLERRFGQSDVKVLKDTCYMWAVTQIATRYARSDMDRALAVLEWLSRNVAPLEKGALPAIPRDVVFRGYGGPRELAWVLVDMLMQSGFGTYVLELPAVQGGAPGRTLVAARVDGRLILLDPLAGIPILDKDLKRVVSVEDCAGDGDPIGQVRLDGEGYPFTAAQVRRAGVRIAAHPYMFLPRMQLLQTYMLRLKTAPRVAVDLPGMLKPWTDEPVQQLPFTDSKTGRVIDVWQLPFDVLMIYSDATFLQKRQSEYAALARYRVGRDATLLGEGAKAAAFYESLVANLDDLAKSQPAVFTPDLCARIRNDALFFGPQARSFAGEAAAAAVGLRKYLADYPDGAWRLLARQELAFSIEKAQGPAAAKAEWVQLDGPRRLFGLLHASGALGSSNAKSEGP